MKRITAIWKHAFLLIVILSAVCLLGNTQKVSAASYSETTCKVIFANAKGQTAGFYHNLAKTVEEGTVIQLPEINRDGYQACLLYTSPSPRARTRDRMPSSA